MKSEPLRTLVLADFTPDLFVGYLNHREEAPRLQATSPGFGQVMSILGDPNHAAWNEPLHVLVVWTRPEQVSPAFQRMLQGAAANVEEAVADAQRLGRAIRECASRVSAVFVPTWVMPVYARHYGRGPLDLRPGMGASEMLLRMNLALVESLGGGNTYVLNTQRWIDAVGHEALNPKFWYLAKVPFAQTVFKEATLDLHAAVRGIYGGARKLILLDLDDTLWGGIVGDDGWENLVLGGHDAVGEALVDFQWALKAVRERGVLLGIVSKNTEAIALGAIRSHPEMILRENDFVGWRINWNDKAANIVELVAELNLGLQSVVFIDDNPVERARIQEALPELLVPEWPADKMLYRTALEGLRCFDAPHASAEDRNRTALYAAESERSHLRDTSDSLEGWLEGLKMAVTVESLTKSNLPRVAQLLNKTNQMNLRTRRLSEQELVDWANHPGHSVWSFTVADRFGSAGLTGILSLRCEEKNAFIEDFVLSCRVIGRRIEETMLHVASTIAQRSGVDELQAVYVQTEKNGPCRELFERSGFHRSTSGTFVWSVAKEYPMPKAIDLSGVEELGR